MSFSETKPLSILDFSEELPVLFFAESLWTNTLDLRPKLYKKIFWQARHAILTIFGGSLSLQVDEKRNKIG